MVAIVAGKGLGLLDTSLNTIGTGGVTGDSVVGQGSSRALLNVANGNLVLQAQDEGMTIARPGASLQDVHNKTVEVIKRGLLTLGLITDTTGDQYKMWYTHGASHFLGIDVHDVGDRKGPRAPGMAFTIEPGIYIRQSALDTLPRTPENNALIDKLQPAVKKYAEIGIRIEDSFLLESSGLRRLSASVPRTIDEIEAFLKPKGSK